MSDLYCDAAMIIQKGDTVKIPVDVYDSCEEDANPVPLDLITEVVYEVFKSRGCTKVLEKSLTNGITILPIDPITNPDENKIEILLDSADTVMLCGVYTHKCYVINSSNEKITIFKSDSLTVNE